MTSNMDVFLKENEVKEDLPKISEEAAQEAHMSYEDRVQTLKDLYQAAPRKVKRKLMPQAKFGNQLMKRFAAKNKQ